MQGGFFADISREILLHSLALVGTPSPRGAAYRAGGTADARRAMGFFLRTFLGKFTLQSCLRGLVLVGSPRGAVYRADGTGDARKAPSSYFWP